MVLRPHRAAQSTVHDTPSVCVCTECVAHIGEPAKTDEPIELPFGMWTRMGPGNHVICGDPDPHRKGQSWKLLTHDGQALIVKHRISAYLSVGTAVTA